MKSQHNHDHHATKEQPQNSPAAETEETAGNEGYNLARLIVVLIVLLVLVNFPLNKEQFGLAQLYSDSESQIIVNGMKFHERESGRLYMLDDHKLRWIVDETWFRQNFGIAKVTVVERESLTRFATGQPIHHLAYCPDDPTVYGIIEARGKKYHLDEALQEQFYPLPTEVGYPVRLERTGRLPAWEQAREVSCDHLANLKTLPLELTP